MKIRPATVGDAREIAEIHVRTWQVAYAGIVPAAFLASLSVEKHEAMWVDSIEQSKPELLVAEDRGHLLGWIAFGPSRDAGASSTVAEIRAIYVAATEWGRGVGRELWLHAQARLQAQGFDAIGLWTFPENARARRFYEALGFVVEPSSAKQFELGGTKLDEVRYARRLGG